MTRVGFFLRDAALSILALVALPSLFSGLLICALVFIGGIPT